MLSVKYCWISSDNKNSTNFSAASLLALAASTPQRSRLLPEVPTLQEAGVAGYDASSWQALHAPARTPPEIVAALSRAALSALADPEAQRRFADAGVDPFPGDPAESVRFLRAETAKWVPILQATGARPG